MSSGVAERLASVRERIAAAARGAGRDPDEVTLLGATKTHAPERVVEALHAGLTDLGENYVQEARVKIEAVAAALRTTPITDPGGAPLPRWHLIGSLQRNKARDAARLFDVVQTVDREALVTALSKHAGAAGRRLEVLLQVNVSGEPQKSGCREDVLPGLWAACRDAERLEAVGLMAVPAFDVEPEVVRPAFARLRELRDALREREGATGMRHLSMGMSGDFEVAIEEGATIVRVGTAIFGPRKESS